MQARIVGIVSGILVSSVLFSSSHASEGTAPSPEVAQNIGPVLVKAYTFQPIHPNPPNHLWFDEGNGRVQFILWSEIHQLEREARIRDFVRILAVKQVKDSLVSRVRRPVNAAMTALQGRWRDSHRFG